MRIVACDESYQTNQMRICDKSHKMPSLELNLSRPITDRAYRNLPHNLGASYVRLISVKEKVEMQTYEEKVQKEDHGGGDVQGLGDGGGHLRRHHPHLAGGGLAAGAEGQLGSVWDRC